MADTTKITKTKAPILVARPQEGQSDEEFAKAFVAALQKRGLKLPKVEAEKPS